MSSFLRMEAPTSILHRSHMFLLLYVITTDVRITEVS